MFRYFPDFILPGVFIAAISYLLGSISFSIIITRLFNHDLDVRTVGSGNAGATNVYRAVGILPSALTFFFDFAKCALSVELGKYIFQYVCNQNSAPIWIMRYGGYIAGLACLLGHIYPLYFKFKGGKGVVTCAAMMVLIDWRVFLINFAIFLIVFLASKIISLSSIVGVGLYPITTFLLTYFLDYRAKGAISLSGVMIGTVITFMIGAVIIAKHKPNIIRLINGTEKKITDKKEKNNKN
ncbi:MAG TPA: glycerol-3-phosphate 1-O-acyltransferase PlsY [Oscillospiraceae bacterium]|nr:glycerol-3-phosphate 1-O-acyltransferase PlsY [Oscillospiraceae bacterium]